MLFGLTAVQFFIIIIAVFAVLYWIIPQKAQWLVFLITIFLLSYMAYYLVPDELDDLSNYFYFIRQLKAGGIDTLHTMIKTDQFEWSTYRVAAYYFYFISFFPNPHYLPAVTVFIVYSLMFLVIHKASVRFQVDKLYTFLGTMFFLSTYWFYDTASGIRNGLTFAVVIACAYYHLVERKNIFLCYIGYILAIFTHSGGIIPVMLVVLTVVTLKTSGKAFNFILIFGTAVASVGINYLAGVTDNSLIQSLASKTEYYTEKGSYDSTTMFSVNVVTFVLVLLLLLYVADYLLKSDYSNDLKYFYKFSSNTLYFLIGAMFLNLVFLRFVRWIIPILGCLIFMIGMQMQKVHIEKTENAQLLYYSSFKDKLFYRMRPFVFLIFIAYIAIHLWYDCSGSSLIWAHFESEWLEAGYNYYW